MVVIENGNSFKPVAQTTTDNAGTLTTLILGPITTEEKPQKKIDVKARSMLLMALPNEHLMTFYKYKDAKSLFAAIETRFGEVKGTARSNSSSQNMDFVSSPSTNSTNEVSTTYGVSTTSTQSSTIGTKISTASSQVSTANLSDATMYALLANQSNGSQHVHEDLEQIHEDDLEEMNLKWQLALLSMRVKREYRQPRNQDSRNWNQDSFRRTVNVEETPPKAMVTIDGVGFDWSYMAEDEVPTNMALMDFLDSENVSEDISNEVKESLAAPLVKDRVSDSKDCLVESPVVVEKKTIVSTVAKIEFVRAKQQEKPVRKPVKYAEMYRSQGPRGNQRNWNNQKSQQLVLMKTGLRPVNTTRPVNTAYPKTTVYSARPMSHFSKSAQSTVKMGYQQRTSLTNKSFRLRTINTARQRLINTARPRPNNTARPNSAVVNAVRVNQVNDVKASACWVWRPTKPNGASITLKRHNYIDVRVRFKHMTGNMSYLFDFKEFNGGYVTFGGGAKGGRITGKGTLKIGKLDFEDVYFVKELKFNLFSVSHMRLGHINFKNINKLVKDNLVGGLPSKRFENDQTCFACLKGKQHKASCKSKVQNSISQPLFMLHMDLFGPTFMSSLMHNTYGLVVTDDYSRYTWVFFLASKNETTGVLKKFITEIENLVGKKVKVIRCDNRTEFKNSVMNDFCVMKDNLGKFDGKSDDGFFVGYSLNSKAFRVYNLRTRKVKETCILGSWRINLVLQKDGSLFHSTSMNARNDKSQPSSDAEHKDDEGVSEESETNNQEKSKNSTQDTVGSSINTASTNDDIEVDMSNITTTYQVPTTTNTRIHKDHSLDHVIGDVQSYVLTRSKLKPTNEQGFISAVYEGKTYEYLNTCLFAYFLSQIEPTRVAKALSDPTWVEAMQEELLQFKLQKGYIQEEGIDYDEVFAPVARIEAIRLFLAYASFMGFMVYQMDVKGAFLYERIEEDVYVCQPLGFEDLDHPDKVYKVVKALYDVKSANTPVDMEKTLVKDVDGGDVDVRLYRSMTGSLMYLIASRLDIMYAVCVCARFLVTPKVSYVHDVKRIFRYLKGHPKLGFWYPRDSLFELVAYTDSDYAGVRLDKKSTTGGCQFLGSRLISWQCKKQTVVATSTTKAEYMAAASCCATTKVKTVNGEEQIQALVDKKKVIITETSVRSDLHLEDVKGTECLPTATIFKQLTLMRESILERAKHKRDKDRRVNDRMMQSKERKDNLSKALDVGLVVMESNETESERHVLSSRSRNNTHTDDADKNFVNEKQPMAEVQLSAEHNILANEQQHSEQSESVYDTYLLEKVDRNTTLESIDMSHRGGEIDQNADDKKFDVNNVLSKPITPHYLPKVREFSPAKPHYVNAPSSSRNNKKESYCSNDMAHNYYLEEAKKKTQDKNRNLKPKEMPSAKTHHTPNACTPKPRSNNQTSRNRTASKSCEETLKAGQKADHSRNPSLFLDFKHFVCSTCQKCVFNANHDSCITKFLKEVNSRAKNQPNKTRNSNKPVDPTSHTQKPGRKIVIGHSFSPNKSSVVHKKTNTPRSCLSNKTAKDLWDALARHMLGSEYGEQDRKDAVLYEYETFKATEGELFLDTLQMINDLKKCGYSKDNCELNFKFLNNLQPEWKQYATMMRQNKNLMDINIDALYNILKQNQGDVNDAIGSKK
nr:uncharacterized mitochondrial protein AtMg00810-like [Tanacetum cinerariifolium]